jgi:hypothetical protein
MVLEPQVIFVRVEVLTVVTMKNAVMLSSGMLCHVALVRTKVSEEYVTSTIIVTRIDELGMLAVTSNQSMLQRNTIYCTIY